MCLPSARAGTSRCYFDGASGESGVNIQMRLCTTEAPKFDPPRKTPDESPISQFEVMLHFSEYRVAPDLTKKIDKETIVCLVGKMLESASRRNLDL